MLKAFRRLGWRPPSAPPFSPRPLSTDSFSDVSSVPGWDTLSSLPLPARRFVAEGVRLCRPSSVQLCDGSPEEGTQLLALLQAQGVLHPLPKYDNCWLARTDPRDVARVEKQTVLVSERERDSVPPPPPSGAPRQLGNWMSPAALEEAVRDRFPGCMQGRRLYAIPFSMGHPSSPLAQTGLQLTDSAYVAASMRIMTRVGPLTNPALERDDFIRCLHSVGRPAETDGALSQWPCDPQRVLVAHQPDRRRVVSYGSGYGGNSLLGKKCVALRIASRLARDQGWLAEHMLILSLTDPRGRTRYVAAAFPSACGKTNLAMMAPALPGWSLRCLGDDIAWMSFDQQGRLRAINPERGFFGVAPGTSPRTNPHAMATLASNTIFTNVGATSDGGVHWEGLDPPPGVAFTDWMGNPWKPGDPRPCAHPNSRFCAPASQCPIMDPAWEDPNGVPIDAIIFGGRRPRGVPLVLEALSWRHGVFLGSAMRSEATAAAEHTGRRLLHDPFAMRPFFGYNAGQYLSHWLALGEKEGAQLPRIFHVNWFLRDPTSGNFLWPGFGHNARVLAWIFSRVVGEDPNPKSTPLGWIPREEALDLRGLQGVSYSQLFPMDRSFWEEETRELRSYYEENFGEDLPREVLGELEALEGRLRKM